MAVYTSKNYRARIAKNLVLISEAEASPKASHLEERVVLKAVSHELRFFQNALIDAMADIAQASKELERLTNIVPLKSDALGGNILAIARNLKSKWAN